MNETTNVLTLPARRRDDPTDTHRSTPAFAVPVPPPLPFDGHDEPFADSLLAQARANRLHAANVALARNEQARLQANQLQKNQLNEAYRAGHDIGLGHGFTRGWYWGLGIGAIAGGSAVALLIKAGQWASKL